MTPRETSELIEVAGGDSAFAKLLGIDGQPGVNQRVNNWKRRGMPPSVELDHYQIIQNLKKRAVANSAA
jgi:hypothetical protein